MNKLKDIRQLFNKPFLFYALVLTTLYFFTRLINLDLIPVFVDEAIYVRWAQVMRNEPTLRFLPLSDGKQPLFMWVLMFILQFFKDPLIAGRTVSLVAGYFTLLGVAFLSWLSGKSRRTVLLASLLYILLPFNLFFDRLALVGSLLACFAIWSLILGILLVDTPRLDLSLLLGFVLGGGLLTKSPGLFLLLLQPVLLLTTKLNKQKLLKIVASWFVSGLLALIFFNILRLGPNFHLINSRNQDYLFSFSQVLRHPFNPLTGNLKKTFTWLSMLIGWPALVAVLITPLTSKRHFKAIFIWSLLPLLAQALVAKVYTPRYILYAVVPLYILVAHALNKTMQRRPKLGFTLTLLTLSLPLTTTIKVLTQPAQAALPQRMKHGYFQEWTAGYGQKDIAKYLKSQAQESPILVGTEGFFGTLPDGLQIYLQGELNITVIGLSYPISGIPESLTSALDQNQVYLVVNKSRNKLNPQHLTQLKLIAQYRKPARPDGTHETLQFYRLLPQK